MEGWTDVDVATIVGRCTERNQVQTKAFILRYDRADMGGDRIFSRNYDRTRSRASYWIQVNYENDSGKMEEYVGRVEYFLKVPHPTRAEVKTLRFAVVNFFKPAEVKKRGQRVEFMKVADVNAPPLRGNQWYPVTPQDVVCQLVSAVEGGVNKTTASAKQTVYFMPFFHMSSQ